MRWLVAVLVALFVGAATVAAVKWHQASSTAADKSAVEQRAAVERTASEVGAALFTYDYRHLATTKQRLLSLSTGGFAAHEAASSSAVERNLVKARASGTAAVNEVSVSDITGNAAAAFVVVASHANATAGSTSSVNYLHMSLQRVNGRWKVAAVQTLNAAAGQ